jgi:hypothetical protein
MAYTERGGQLADRLRASAVEVLQNSNPTLLKIDSEVDVDSAGVFINAFRQSAQPCTNGRRAVLAGVIDHGQSADRGLGFVVCRQPVSLRFAIQNQGQRGTVAALVQDYRFGVIVGEATSDMATTYGTMEQFALKHTGLRVGCPKARLVRPNGDLRSRGVTPIRVPIVQSPRDEVLRQAIAITRR